MPSLVPVPSEEIALGRARAGEGNRAWSAGAGTGALATGLVQAAWVVREIRRRNPDEALWIDWGDFAAVGRGLLVWEAFVTSAAKGVSHVDDAAIAVEAFTSALPDPGSTSTVTAERPLSLIGVAALCSGWSTDCALLHVAPLVVRADCPSRANRESPRKAGRLRSEPAPTGAARSARARVGELRDRPVAAPEQLHCFTPELRRVRRDLPAAPRTRVHSCP